MYLCSGAHTSTFFGQVWIYVGQKNPLSGRVTWRSAIYNRWQAIYWVCKHILSLVCWPEEEALMYEQSMKHISLKNSCHPLCRTHFSGGSRGGSMGSMEPPLLKDCLRKYYAQMYTYTTFTLELCTSASTVAITHMCQLLYQEFDMRMAHVHIYTTRSMWQQQRQWVKQASEL